MTNLEQGFTASVFESERTKEEFPFWSEKIQKAYEIGKKAHEGQKRKTGEPYFTHCVTVAGIVEDWIFQGQKAEVVLSCFETTQFIEELMCAALLHDTVEDTELTLKDIEVEFGEEVGKLVDGVSKLKSGESTKGDHETIRKVLQGYFIDPRVGILKLADRVHNMRTLGQMKKEKRFPKAWETEEIYARLAEALGMWEVMRDLKDASFPYLFPAHFEEVKNILELDLRRKPEYIQAISTEIDRVLSKARIKGEIDHRLGGYRMIDQKRRRLMRPRKSEFGGYGYADISDVMSIGATLDSETECYAFLGHLRSHFKDLIDYDRSEDSIAVPADNGYRVLREVVNFPFGAVEVAIMTPEMRDFNNWGVISLIRQGVEDLSQYSLKFVFTPDDEVRVLPLEATGWDVAAAINPQLVLTMRAIKVNGEFYLPSTKVPHASEIEVITGNGWGAFIQDGSWRQENTTPKTRKILEEAQRRVEFDAQVVKGQLKAKEILAKRGVLAIEDIVLELEPRLAEFGCRNLAELLFAIGVGEMDEERVNRILDKDDKFTKESMGLTTIFVSGKDAPGIAHHLTGIVHERGGNIVKIVNAGTNKFELRLVVKGLTKEKEGLIREILAVDGRFEEIRVV